MVLQDDLILDDDFTVSIDYSRGIIEPSKHGYTVGSSKTCLKIQMWSTKRRSRKCLQEMEGKKAGKWHRKRVRK